MFDLRKHPGDVDASMHRRKSREASRCLFELPLAPPAVAATRLVPRDRDVHEALEEVALVGRRRTPLELELLVSGEERARPDELDAAKEVRPGRPRPPRAPRTC